MVQQVEEKAHAVLGPSGFDRWGTCPGSVPLSEGIPNTSSRYARLGTAAHQLLEDCLVGGLDAEDLIGREYNVEGEIFEVDTEMADAVDAAINAIKDMVDVDAGDILMPEQEVPLQQLTGEKDAEGTSDVIAITNGGKMLVVMDYKHGQGVKVYASSYLSEEELAAGHAPEPNGQMAMYGLGALHKYGMIYDEIETVKLVLLQPRLEHVDEIEMSVDELLAFGAKVTEAAGRVEINRDLHAQGEEVELVPSEKGCKFCPVKHSCPALRAEASNAMALVSSKDDFEDLTLPKQAASVVVNDEVEAEKLAEAMRAAPMIEQFLKDVRAEVERRLLAGLPVPGYHLIKGRAPARKWKDEEAALAELTKNASRLKVAEATTSKVISPTQAEKLLKEKPKIWKQIVDLIDDGGPGKPSVAKIEDGGTPYLLPSSAPEDFEDLSEGGAAFDLMAD